MSTNARQTEDGRIFIDGAIGGRRFHIEFDADGDLVSARCELDMGDPTPGGPNDFGCGCSPHPKMFDD